MIVELTPNVVLGKGKSEGLPGSKSMSEIDTFCCNVYFKVCLNVFLISDVMSW